MKKITLLAISIAFTITLLGCETLKGIGKDIENTGKNIGDGLKNIENHNSSNQTK